jgi:hypothetical protein
MKITPFFPVAPGATTQRTRRTSSTGGANFSEFLSGAEDATETGEARPAAPVSSLAGILSVQEVSDEEVKRQKAYKQASLTLDTLEELRNALLLGGVPMHVLTRLSQRIAEQKLEVNDPHLLAVMKDIELRAAVELAKLERMAGK